MKIEELVTLAKERNELDFLFDLCKIVAESDSIGEGYGYCNKYTREQFNEGQVFIVSDYRARGFKDHYCDYLVEAGAPLYERYLTQIGAI